MDGSTAGAMEVRQSKCSAGGKNSLLLCTVLTWACLYCIHIHVVMDVCIHTHTQSEAAMKMNAALAGGAYWSA